MHETGIVKDLVHRVEKAATQACARRVSGVHVWIGALSQFSAEHFRSHFEDESRGTLAQGALLQIEVSTDERHPSALQVVVKSVDLEI